MLIFILGILLVVLMVRLAPPVQNCPDTNAALGSFTRTRVKFSILPIHNEVTAQLFCLDDKAPLHGTMVKLPFLYCPQHALYDVKKSEALLNEMCTTRERLAELDPESFFKTEDIIDAVKLERTQNNKKIAVIDPNRRLPLKKQVSLDGWLMITNEKAQLEKMLIFESVVSRIHRNILNRKSSHPDIATFLSEPGIVVQSQRRVDSMVSLITHHADVLIAVIAEPVEDHECIICYTEASEYHNCGHWFHSDCIKPWIAQHGTCPICKRTILV